jgi:hypothetical protein
MRKTKNEIPEKTRGQTVELLNARLENGVPKGAAEPVIGEHR